MPPQTFIEILQRRAADCPDRTLYTFLADGEKTEQTLRYRELDRRARAIAARLQDAGMRGERALLLHLPGTEFIAAFFGCLYAGVIAVPAYPPQRQRNIGRLLAIIEDAQVRLCLTESAILAGVDSVKAAYPALRDMQWIPTDRVDAGDASAWREPDIAAEDIAFLQYTSGSTNEPKGVMVSHANLLHNEAVIEAAYGHSEATVGVGWLPFYHDMGLIGKVLQPLYLGIHCVLMSPISFLQKPLRWLQAISRYRGTTSVSPNFGYDLCVRKISAAEIETLDLSCWQVAANGAEPIRAETIERFSETFAPCGFRREAFYPCYGLAEATLFVTGGDSARAPSIIEVDAAALERARVEPPAPGAGRRRLVGCGRTWLGHEVVVVDPESRTRVGDGEVGQIGEVGEIWVAGPSVARGYWNRPELDREVFGAHLADTGEGPYLRTGDLGFMARGELFVTGRRKDLIIIRGRNHYPQDIEYTVAAHPAVRSGGVIAFSVEEDGQEQLVVVCEVARAALAGFDAHSVSEAVVQAVAEQHELQLHALVFLGPGELPKTSSGKVQRQRCKAMYRDHALAQVAVAAWQRGSGPHDETPAAPEQGREAGAGDIARDDAGDIAAWIGRWLAAKLELDAGAIDPRKPLARYGLDSILAVELAQSLADELGVVVDASAPWEHPTIAALAAHVAAASGPAEEAGARARQADATPAAPRDEIIPLSAHQTPFWYIYQSAPDSAAYNAAFAMRIHGAYRADALQQAFQYLVDRHPMLRTTYAIRDDEPVQIIHAHQDAYFEIIDASSWDDDALRQRVVDVYAQPFDLARGPVCKAYLFTRRDDAVLLLDVHHIACDALSMNQMLGELVAAYEALATGAQPDLAPLASSYQAFVHEQKHRLESGALDRHLAYWTQQLAGELPLLALATDRPRPAYQTYNGSTCHFELTRSQTAALQAFARQRGTTVYAVLLAAFHGLLHRYTGQDDILIGVPMFGRDLVRYRDAVGSFINTLPIRGRVRAEDTFADLLDRVQGTLRDGLAHMEYPFARLLAHLSIQRDLSRPPVFQVVFNFQRIDDEVLETLVWGGARRDARMRWGPLTVSRFDMEQEEGQFDITLDIAEGKEILHGAIKYNTDLFEAATIERMAGHYVTLVDNAIRAPEAPVTGLPMLSQKERATLLASSRGPDWSYPPAWDVVHGFEEQAASTPDHVAVVCEDRQLSYRQLDHSASQLAHWLRDRHQVKPGDVVGLAVGRTEWRIAALLGILKAGAAYVPIEPAHPDERNELILTDAGAKVVLTDEEGRRYGESCLQIGHGHWDQVATYPVESPARGDQSTNLAYILYTSGSTGTPKGVQVSHRNLAHTLAAAQRAFGFDTTTVMPLLASHIFDISLFEIFCPLLSGGTCLVVEEGDMLEPQRLQRLLERITAIHAVPSLMKEIVRIARDSGDSYPHIEKIFTGGDYVPHALLGELQAVFAQAQIYELYGPTEGTLICSSYHYDGAYAEADKNIIGAPLPNVSLYLLDPLLELVPVGVPGEICIAGNGVAQGYTRRELDADKFVDDPLGPFGRGRMYRTGDLGRWLPGGMIEFLGRRDDQAKIRGHRIELGEIENILQKHPDVAQAAVVVTTKGGGDRNGDKCLAAYVVMTAGELDARGLRSYLQQRVPEFMVPPYFVQLERIPLNANGKVDKKALPALDHAAAMNDGYVAPRTAVEEALAGIWAEMLGRPRVGVRDDFFVLGGHSLMALRVLARLRDALAVELPVRALFDAPTVAALAAQVEEARRRERKATLPRLERAQGEDRSALSFAQKRLWFLDQLDPGSPLYNVPLAAELQGRLDRAALEHGLRALVERHEVLRTTFTAVGGAPRQVIAPATDVPLAVHDLQALSREQRDAEVHRRAVKEAQRPFDLAAGPLLRATLLVLDPDRHVLLFTFHHIVFDGWSTGILLRELGALYTACAAGEPPVLDELPVQYADYALWQRQWFESGVRDAELAYWKRELARAPAFLDVPADRRRPAVQSHNGATYTFELPSALVDAVDALGRSAGATRFMTLLAAFSALLGRYAGVEEVCVGSPVAGRPRPELEELIGFFVNTLVLRCDLSGDPTVAEFLGRVRDTTLGAYEHQNVPFEEVVDALAPPRDPSRTPLFQVMFALQNAPMPALELGDATLRPLEIDSGIAKFELSLVFDEMDEEAGGGMRGVMEYNTDLFEATTIERMVRHFQALLEALVAHPGRRLSELSILSTEERHTLLDEWNDTGRDIPDHACIHELFQQQAARSPERTAVVFENQTLSYRELEGRANQLAHYLRELGVGPEMRVGVYLERSLDMVVALLGILGAGGAYVPLDPRDPPQRRAFILDDCTPIAIVTHEHLRQHLEHPPGAPRIVCLDTDASDIAARPDTRPTSGVTSSNLAYVIYTSGSTGKPKGAMNQHRPVCNRLLWMRDAHGLGPSHSVLQKTPFTFDVSAWELFNPLITGARLVVARPEGHKDVDYLVDIISREQITTVHFVPSMLQAFLQAGGLSGCGSLENVICSGEALPLDVVERFYERLPHVTLHNLYGPTEAAIEVTAWTCRRHDERSFVPIGRPISNVRTYVLDARLEPVPVGLQGELYLGGVCVARGYVNRPGLTADRFLPDPHAAEPGARMYRTGDVARVHPDGVIEYCGRTDHQVKVRGFRIELGEIEAALEEHAGVARAVAVVREERGSKWLVAYIAPRSNSEVSQAALKQHLDGLLPGYMVPQALVLLESLPLTPSGKVDRRALPAPDRARFDIGQAYAPPRTPLEEALCAIVGEVLGVERVGLHDDFFALGGHSLLAVQVVSRVRDRFAIELPLRALFEQPSVAGLAAAVEVALGAGIAVEDHDPERAMADSDLEEGEL